MVPRSVRYLRTAALALLLLLLGPPEAALATNVSGTISTNTTWSQVNSPYVMTGNVTVAAGVTLTIEPGVIVQGNASTRLLTVNGSLSAIGTATQPITFTSTSDSAPGQWNGISFSSGVGGRTFNVPKDVWDAMSPREQWAANQRFLDRGIARGSDIKLATPAEAAREGSSYERELQYLISKGYRLAPGGGRMIPPGG